MNAIFDRVAGRAKRTFRRATLKYQTEGVTIRGLYLSIRDAVLTVSPKRQYQGFREPTTFATTGPE